MVTAPWTLTIQSIVDDGKNFNINYLVFDGVSTTYGPTLLLLSNATAIDKVTSTLQGIVGTHPKSALQMVSNQASPTAVQVGVYSLIGTSLVG